jgi:tRNA pseudouridine38-40 synthase
VNIYKIVVEYNGKNFYGSQIQGSLRTVEGVLKDVLSQLLNKKFKLVFVSRTDRGVHSLCNIAKLSCNNKIDTKTFLEKINFLLPKDLQVKKILSLKKDFNPRKVKYKIYQYTIYNSKNLPTLYSDYVWWIKEKLSLSKLKKAAKIKVSKFQDFIKINFKGSRFLHRLVRNIVALLVEVGKGKISFEELKDIIKNWKYCKLKPAPPQGLVLLKIVI